MATIDEVSQIATDTEQATAATVDEVSQSAKDAEKATAATVDEVSQSATDAEKASATTVDEVCHKAMRSYEERMEDFVETFKRTSNQTIDLFEKTLGVYRATSVTDAQRRVQDLIKSLLSTLRVNVNSALNMNAEIIASWKELVDRFGPAVK